jgi:hypothetical protein
VGCCCWVEASTADYRLLNAVAVILDNAARRPRYLEPDEIDLAFASDRWKKLVLEQVEGEKRLRYSDLVASAVILHNVVDMSRILAQLKAEGYNVRDEDRNFLSPHLTGCIKRFGDYTVNMAKPPEPWLDDQVPPRKGPIGRPTRQFCSLSAKRKPRGIGTSDAVLRWRKSLWWIFTLISAGGLEGMCFVS